MVTRGINARRAHAIDRHVSMLGARVAVRVCLGVPWSSERSRLSTAVLCRAEHLQRGRCLPALRQPRYWPHAVIHAIHTKDSSFALELLHACHAFAVLLFRMRTCVGQALCPLTLALLHAADLQLGRL